VLLSRNLYIIDKGLFLNEIKIMREKLHQIFDEMGDKRAETAYSLFMGEFEKVTFRKKVFFMKERNT
jgi:hypothetical protein